MIEAEDTLEFNILRASELNAKIPAGLQNNHVVRADTLNVRSGPGTTYSIMRQLHVGDKVNVLSVDGSWAKISSYEWVFYDYLKKV